MPPPRRPRVGYRSPPTAGISGFGYDDDSAPAETAVLAVLAPGGMSTAEQFTREAQLSIWSTRRTIGQLESRGLITALQHAARWIITPRGSAVAANPC